MKKYIAFAFLLISFFAGCSFKEDTGPASAVESYLHALADQNKEEIINLSCKSWEEQAALEVDALLSVGSEVNDLACVTNGEEDGFTLVKCSGNLDLTYNEEIRVIEIDRRTYYLRQEDGQWRVCSYK